MILFNINFLFFLTLSPISIYIISLSIYRKQYACTAGKPVTQESSLDVFCHVIFDVNIDVMDVKGRPQEFVAL